MTLFLVLSWPDELCAQDLSNYELHPGCFYITMASDLMQPGRDWMLKQSVKTVLL